MYDNKQGPCLSIDVAIPADRNVIKTEAEWVLKYKDISKPVPVAARSKAWVCGRSTAEILGSNPTWGTDVCLL